MADSPPFLALDLTGQCNLDCTGCVLAEDYPARGEMKQATLARLEPILADLPGISIGCNAEPLLRPGAAEEAVRWLRARGMRGHLMLITNASLLGAGRARDLVSADLDEAAVSLDGTTPEVFERIRRGASFEAVLANVRGLVEARRDLGRARPSLTVLFTSRRSNLADLAGIVDLAASLGAAKVVVNGLEPYRRAGEAEVLYGQGASEEVRPIFDHLRDRARKRGLALALPELDLRETRACGFLVPTLGWQGDLSPCPATSYARTFFVRGEQRRHPRIVFGNVREQGFEEIWGSGPYRAFRAQAREGLTEPACRGCLVATGVVCPAEGRG